MTILLQILCAAKLPADYFQRSFG